MSPTHRIAASFAAAADSYDRHAGLQRLVARQLAERIAQAYRAPPGRRSPLRILEIGAGTGLLAEALAPRLADAGLDACWTVSDLAPDMLRRAEARLGGGAQPGAWRFTTLDLADTAAIAALDGPFDLICGSLAWQWLPDRAATLRALAVLLAPDGRIALSTLLDGSLAEWQAAWGGTLRDWPAAATLQAEWPGPGGRWDEAGIAVSHAGARGFLRDLRGIGAAIGTARPDPARLRAAIRRLDAATGGDVSYRIGYGSWRRPPRPGVFVTGTDTGIGKTLVSAILARALGAAYFKPIQTGLADEVGDTPTVAELAGVRVHPPAIALAAPLSPQDAARAEGVAIDACALSLPPGDGPLVVEGAGGLLVPIDGEVLMVDLIARFGLPAVLVARSTLGTINHTLLSLEALRARGIAIAGVVLSGPPDAANRRAIETLGRVRVLAEIPRLETVDAEAVARWGFVP